MSKHRDIFSPKQHWSPEARSAVTGTYAKLYASLDEVSELLKAAGVDVPHGSGQSGLPLAALEKEVKNRRAQLNAHQLGVPFSADERAHTIEERILDMMPDILANKGFVVGAVVLKNHGGKPDQPHEILGIMENDDETVHLRDLSGEFGDYNYHVKQFALYATLYDPTAPTEQGPSV